MASDRGSRLETLHWSGSFILIDRTHKTNIHNLSMVGATVVNSLGISIPVGFFS